MFCIYSGIPAKVRSILFQCMSICNLYGNNILWCDDHASLTLFSACVDPICIKDYTLPVEFYTDTLGDEYSDRFSKMAMV